MICDKIELRGQFATQGIKKMANRTFSEFSSNLEELIVNAYDADATNVKVEVNKDTKEIKIVDNGSGMNMGIIEKFLIYGESEKDSQYKSPIFSRSPIGEYGMGGKLAISNISRNCDIKTCRNGIEYKFTMDQKSLSDAKYVSDVKTIVNKTISDNAINGTEIILRNLTYKKIDETIMIDRFSRKMPISQNFEIEVSVIKNGNKKIYPIKEHHYEYEKKFEFHQELSLVGNVDLIIYFTKEALPTNRQGIWTKVNGRIVNEKTEWFDLLSMTSGNKYRYRFYGVANADGLKDFIIFAKNDFVQDSDQYKEYYKYVKSCVYQVQKELLKSDENKKKEKDRQIVKDIENKINKIVSELDKPINIGKLISKIRKVKTENEELAPENPYPNFDTLFRSDIDIENKRTQDKEKRRNQELESTKTKTFSGHEYKIEIVDMSEYGDLVKFSRQKKIIEINENNKAYLESSKKDYLGIFIQTVAISMIATDYSSDFKDLSYDEIYNKLIDIAYNI